MNLHRSPKVKQLLAKMYDAAYDLNSLLQYPDDIQGILTLIEQFVKKSNFKLQLNDRTQKYEVKSETEKNTQELKREIFLTTKGIVFNNVDYAIEVEELSNGAIEINIFHRHGELIETLNYD